MNGTPERLDLEAMRLRLLELRLAAGVAASLPGRGPRLGILREVLRRLPPERDVADLVAFEAMVSLLFDRGAQADQVVPVINRQRLGRSHLAGETPAAELVAAWLLAKGLLG